MRFSSIFAASPAIAILSIELLCGLSGPAQAATGSATSLPGVMVEAPKQVARPKHGTVARSTVSHRASQTTQTPSAPESVSGKLAKLASATGSCVGGCLTSFRYGNPLARMLRVRLASVVVHVQKHRQLQNLRRVHGGRTVNGLEKQ
jgi:hypothetical protein